MDHRSVSGASSVDAQGFPPCFAHCFPPQHGRCQLKWDCHSASSTGFETTTFMTAAQCPLFHAHNPLIQTRACARMARHPELKDVPATATTVPPRELTNACNAHRVTKRADRSVEQAGDGPSRAVGDRLTSLSAILPLLSLRRPARRVSTSRKCIPRNTDSESAMCQSESNRQVNRKAG